jgi:NCS1 family nucleobase:cation symporter-1
MTTAPTSAAAPPDSPAYGDKVIAVEPAGAEPIPPAERHGSPVQLLWTWASPNIEFATVFIGVLPVIAFGLTFWQTAVALVLGTAVGAVFQGILSLEGPRFGVPQMVAGRLGFGYRGNALPSGINAAVAGIGWFAVNSVSAAFALDTLTGLHPLPSLFLVVAAQIAVGFIGHNFVHTFERYAFPVLGVIFVLAAIWTFGKADLSAPAAYHGGTAGFLLAFSTAFGYAAGWNSYASDYTRYLPQATAKWKTALYPALGLFVSVTFIALIGAASATIASPKDATPTAAFTGHLPGWLGNLTLLAIIIGAISANALNVYSSAISFAAMGIRLPAWLGRSTLVVVFGVLGLLFAWSGLSDAGSSYEAFLLIISYWVAPWLGVVFVEQWLSRRAPHDGLAARLTDASYANWAGPVALVVGMAVSISLFSNQTKYVGWAAKHWSGIGDITCVVGFAVSAALYAALRPVFRARA